MHSIDAEWLSGAHEQFAKLFARFPHALLIHGKAGIGKFDLAADIVASLLCDQPLHQQNQIQACGNCPNCALFAAGNQPDFHFISNEDFADSDKNYFPNYAARYLEDAHKRKKRKAKKIVSVDQIRQLISDFSLSHHSAQHKVALIHPANAMNINAANALLKLLEEPNPQSILILISDDISRLPMTIRSRCITLKVAQPSAEQGLSYLIKQGLEQTVAHKALALANGSPYLANDYTQSDQIDHFETLLTTLSAVQQGTSNPIEASSQLLKQQSLPSLLNGLQNIMHWQINALMQPQEKTATLAYQDKIAGLLPTLSTAHLPLLFKLFDDLSAAKQKNLEVINPNLLLEKWLISFSQNLKTRVA